MVRATIWMIEKLNLLTLWLSVSIVGVGIWQATIGSPDCANFLQPPVMAVGISMMAVSIVGMLGARYRVTWMLCVYVFAAFVLINLLFCFIIFPLVATNVEASEVLNTFSRGHEERSPENYSNWLQWRVQNPQNWPKIRTCLRNAQICKTLRHGSADSDAGQSFHKSISTIQSGCCKPPTSCDFIYVNRMVWGEPAKKIHSWTDTDCNTWSNDHSVLCYDCNTCKDGVLSNLKKDWLNFALVNIVFLILQSLAYFIASRACMDELLR